MHKKILAAGSALLLVAGLMALGAGPAAAGGGGDNDGKICQEFSTGRIGGDNQMSVEVTAPAGKLISEYCVKAGSIYNGFGPQYVHLDPPVDHVTISYQYNGVRKQISHYSVLYVDQTTTDVCPNLGGVQSSLPSGYRMDNGTCVPPATTADLCQNLPGNQETMPAGYVLKNGTCVVETSTPTPPTPPTDLCQNMQGNQKTVPTGYVVKDGDCVIAPPTDVCRNIGGPQATAPAGMMVDGSGDCVDIPDSLAVAGTVTVTDPTCSAAGALVLGSGAFATWSDVSYSGAHKLHYAVTAIAQGDRLFANGQSTLAFDGVLPDALPATDPACRDLPTHPLVTPAVSSKNLSCQAPGSYTLASLEGTDEGIVWTVDGKVVTAGTHRVTSAGTVHVTAAPEAPDFGFDFETPTSWTLIFTEAKDCGDLTTLALTGGDSNSINLGLLFAGGLLLLGGALVIAEKTARFGANK